MGYMLQKIFLCQMLACFILGFKTIYKACIGTLPKTNIPPLKMGPPKRNVVSQPPIFRDYVSFREGNDGQVKFLKQGLGGSTADLRTLIGSPGPQVKMQPLVQLKVTWNHQEVIVVARSCLRVKHLAGYAIRQYVFGFLEIEPLLFRFYHSHLLLKIRAFVVEISFSNLARCRSRPNEILIQSIYNITWGVVMHDYLHLYGYMHVVYIGIRRTYIHINLGIYICDFICIGSPPPPSNSHLQDY